MESKERTEVCVVVAVVNVSQGMAQPETHERCRSHTAYTKTEPTIVPVLVTNNLTEKIDTKVQVTNNASM